MLSQRPAHGPDEAVSSDECTVNDKRFVGRVFLLRDLHAFLLYNGVSINGAGDDATSQISELCHLRYRRWGARSPTHEQRASLDRSIENLFALTSGPLRQRFLLSQVPTWVPESAPYWLAATLASVLLLAIAESPETLAIILGFSHITSDGSKYTVGIQLVAYLFWLVSVGALGAICSIAMNVLSVQEDETFDLTNSRLLAVRLIVGVLFGLMLSLPFGFDAFRSFGRQLVGLDTTITISAASLTPMPGKGPWLQALFLLLPFLLGYSTSLVILVLTRLIAGLQAVFGRQPASRIPDPPAAPTFAFPGTSPTPTLFAVTPTTSAEGELVLAASGSNFVNGAALRMGAQELRTTVMDNSNLTAIVPAGVLPQGTSATLTVCNPPPGGGISNAKVVSVDELATAAGNDESDLDGCGCIVTSPTRDEELPVAKGGIEQ
ncbi:hypothetical protein EOS_27915 [Caballeronia mineralivorans PML1(12)]|uniref:IPT/TIG domain-containing protein n=1 Tax=Caballeronia mineralivorans PML1(12) TaxID=908627 RepID=A0A0J1CQN6_9BURK|nr:hypothetical protein [Caballeronia mineralivorans]KLU22959.1 hypothetical protein EOS_27915 [Caballeronia mineralivorans PML1(12)]